MLSKREVVIEVIGGQVGEIGWGRESLALRGGYQAHVLSVAWPFRVWGRECRGSAGGDVDTEVEGVGCRIGENVQEVGDFTPNGRY
jgi:hypothetical protein